MAVSGERGEEGGEKLFFPPCTRPGASSSMTAAAVKVMPGQFHPKPIQSIQLSIAATFIFFFFAQWNFFANPFPAVAVLQVAEKMVETEMSFVEKFFWEAVS